MGRDHPRSPPTHLERIRRRPRPTYLSGEVLDRAVKQGDERLIARMNEIK